MSQSIRTQQVKIKCQSSLKVIQLSRMRLLSGLVCGSLQKIRKLGFVSNMR